MGGKAASGRDESSGIELVAADMPVANKLTFHIPAAAADHEREAISERTKATLAAAKARGWRGSSPILQPSRILCHGNLPLRATCLVAPDRSTSAR
jgi:DNA invertase Pin-like site-specific DNA recombinase